MTKQFLLKIAPVFLVLLGLPALIVPAFRAQSLGTSVTISTMPTGMVYSVDGQLYQQPSRAVWPVGSKHVLSVISLVQDELRNKTIYNFKDWEYGTGSVVPGGNTVIITADPAQPEFHAVFAVQFALDIVFFSCPDPTNCASPGTIYVNNSAVHSDTEMYVDASSVVTLSAIPGPGYVFTGWLPGPHQTIQGFANSVSMTEPVIVRPVFQPIRRINLTTIPDGLQVYADRAQVPTPNTMEWGFNTTHSVGAVSPQQAKDGTWWAFQSWSDGGASTHAYTVAPNQAADTLTATYVPVGVTAIYSSPFGLKIKVDGRDNWSTYNFPWGIGETHTIEAPAQQTDDQGRIWSFVSWSNGGPAAQTFVVPASAANGGVRLIATYAPVGRLMINSPVTAAIDVDGTPCTTPCDLQRPTGTTVHVTAPSSVSLSEGSRADFTGWAGSGTSATDWSGTLGSDPVTLTATFRTMNRLATSAAPSDGASLTLQPGSPDGFYDAASTVVVSASARPGFKFRNWTGDLTGTIASGSLSMNAPHSVQAILDRVPYIAPAGISNAVGVTPQTAVAPGSVVSIFGASLAASTAVGPDSPLVQTLGGVTVRINDQYLPLYFISPTQINLQLPPDLGPGDQTLIVSSQGMPDVKGTFTVARNAPGLFQQSSNGIAFAAALHEDGSAVTSDSPAKSGELLTVYGTGFGPTTPARPEGFAVPASPAYTTSDTVTVQVGAYAVPASAAFAAPGRVGIDAVQFRLGAGSPSATNADLHVTINGQDSNSVTLPIQ